MDNSVDLDELFAGAWKPIQVRVPETKDGVTMMTYLSLCPLEYDMHVISLLGVLSRMDIQMRS